MKTYPQPPVTQADRSLGAAIVRESAAADREAMALRMLQGEMDDCPLLLSLARVRVHGMMHGALQMAAPTPAKPDNPSAFPWQVLTNGTTDNGGSGMTLWDHYFGQAMVGCIIDRASWGVDHAAKAPDFASWAADIADAMMAERARRLA